MNGKEFLEILKIAARLKQNTRHCDTEPGRKESVADHSWRIALMGMLLSGEQEFEAVDMNKVIRMCLIHDLGEAFTGDIPTFEKTESNADREDQIFSDWTAGFSSPQREEWLGLLEEMKEMKTPEAKTYKALDKLEAVISHNESDISTWLPLEYELQFTYGKEQVEFSPYLKSLKEEIDQWTREKIKTEKLRVLSKVGKSLNEAGITWAVGASLLLYLKGIVNEFQDIDLMIKTEDISKTKEILQSMGKMIPPKKDARYQTKYFLEFVIDEVDFDVMGGFAIVDEEEIHDCSLKPEQIEEKVLVEGVMIPLQSLALWKKYYTWMHREQKADLIENFLKKY